MFFEKIHISIPSMIITLAIMANVICYSLEVHCWDWIFISEQQESIITGADTHTFLEQLSGLELMSWRYNLMGSSSSMEVLA